MSTANLDIRLRIKDDGSVAITQVRDKLGDVGRVGAGAGRRIADTFGLANKAVAALGISLGAAALVGYGKRMLANADATAKAADKIGLTTRALQELRYAAQLSGVEQGTLDMAMQRFSRRVGEAAQGGGELLGTLEQYGIAVRNADGSTREFDDVLGDVADAIAGARSEQERLRIAFKAFDSEGAALVNTLKNGRSGLRDVRQEARDLGLVLDDTLLREAERANDEFSRLSGTLNAGLTRAFLDMAPALHDAAEDLRAFLQESDWESWATEASTAIQNVLRELRAFNEIGMRLPSPFGGETKPVGTLAEDLRNIYDPHGAAALRWIEGETETEQYLEKLREETAALVQEQESLHAALRNLEAYGKAIDPNSFRFLDPDQVQDRLAEIKTRLAEIDRLQTYTVPPGNAFVGPPEPTPADRRSPAPSPLDTATWGQHYSDFWAGQGERDARAYWEAHARAMGQLAASAPDPYSVPGADATHPAAEYNPYTEPGGDADMPALQIYEEQHARWAEMEWQKAVVQQRVQDLLTQQEQESEEQRLAAAKKASDEREALLRSGLSVAQSVFGDYAGFMRQMYEDSGGQQRKYWEAYKAFAIAETIVSTATASMNAYKALAGIPYAGPALGAAAATAVGVLGAAKVALISQQEPAKAFAEGGIFMTPFEGPIQAAEPGVGPEVIAPISKLPELLAKAGGPSTSAQPLYDVTINLPLRGDVSPETVARIQNGILQVLPRAMRQVQRYDPRSRRN